MNILQSPNTPALKQPWGGMKRNHGGVLWFTGLSGAGKTTLAQSLYQVFADMGLLAFVLDGDELRRGLCRDLGFSVADRRENIRRTAEVAALFSSAGFLCITALISPFIADRAQARAIIGVSRFLEIYLAVDISVCEARDPKGLYRRARSGEITDFTGIHSSYEPPQHPDLVLDTHALSISACTRKILSLLLNQQWIY